MSMDSIDSINDLPRTLLEYIQIPLLAKVGVALLLAALIAFAATPTVRKLAKKIGAVDVPKDERRMHSKPIPRMGGLAIFFGFVVTALVCVEMTGQIRGMLIGALMIVVLGVLDDKFALPALPKFLVQIAAALVAVYYGNVIQFVSNPNVFSVEPYWDLGVLAIPITVFWIVAITNAVNLIDGLDGLAAGVATISAVSMMVIAMFFGQATVAVLMAAIAGACLGFLPYNLNPAKIFMGDTGSTFLGFVLATVSIHGLFKFYAIISFAVPFLLLGLPLFDTCFAILRRISRGQNPMSPDRSHVHHRLIDMGMNQKQAVAILYIISAVLGMCAVVLTTSGEIKAMILMIAFLITGLIGARIYLINHRTTTEALENLVPEQPTEIPEGDSNIEEAVAEKQISEEETPSEAEDTQAEDLEADMDTDAAETQEQEVPTEEPETPATQEAATPPEDAD